MVTVKDVKNGKTPGAPIYHHKPYIVVKNNGPILASDTLDKIKSLFGYDNCEVRVRDHGLYLNDNTKISNKQETHTPGPWENADVFIYSKETGDPIIGTKGTSKADRDLIAAAPELLESLEFIMPALEHLRKQFPRSENDDSLDILQVARAAIAKARGVNK